ncbi:uncharacterized protein Z519_12074 [Cladophialophora bantiana CBS 173.52]|uniref:Uncharacterized protein n=1 Tax=Cladophialophora bantiana (strain ATCC 10958 / CBS 173.52 / CDC B-1940 / NIH 8579) TaxID=1442370 RepID=A0A0D2H2A1_CLAB1|nr:uncharacterized protein Z519_12074 [Cladophialophora bantiana CBS 173.52]KIW87438.1 hypothetical protein Z519_12074 [Cladophialophora bantiana CBS 173.52]
MTLAFILVDPDKLRRNDGTAIAKYEHLSAWQDVCQTVALLRDPVILLLTPTFFTLEIFFPFMASVNAYTFNLRTRTLNAILGNAIQIPWTLLASGCVVEHSSTESEEYLLVMELCRFDLSMPVSGLEP